jgi:hypothetical protein
VSIPYPRFDEDQQLRMEEARAAHARAQLDPSDVLSEVQHLMLEIADDEEHPLWHLMRHCVTIGTERETGPMPHMAAEVGAKLLPRIDKAIKQLVDVKLADFGAWED